MHSVSQHLRKFELLFLQKVFIVSLTDGVVFRNLSCFLQDLLGGCPLGQDREFGPEREIASDPGQPSVPPVCPHTGNPPTPNPHHLQLSISGLSLSLCCLLHSPAFCFHSSVHGVTLTGRLFVLQLILNPFSSTISSSSLPP